MGSMVHVSSRASAYFGFWQKEEFRVGVERISQPFSGMRYNFGTNFRISLYDETSEIL